MLVAGKKKEKKEKKILLQSTNFFAKSSLTKISFAFKVLLLLPSPSQQSTSSLLLHFALNEIMLKQVVGELLH